VLTLAMMPLLYVNAWLSLAAAIGAYLVAAKLANRHMNRVFLNRNLNKLGQTKWWEHAQSPEGDRQCGADDNHCHQHREHDASTVVAGGLIGHGNTSS
jgi:hypothetical protein